MTLRRRSNLRLLQLLNPKIKLKRARFISAMTRSTTWMRNLRKEDSLNKSKRLKKNSSQMRKKPWKILMELQKRRNSQLRKSQESLLSIHALNVGRSYSTTQFLKSTRVNSKEWDATQGREATTKRNAHHTFWPGKNGWSHHSKKLDSKVKSSAQLQVAVTRLGITLILGSNALALSSFARLIKSRRQMLMRFRNLFWF